MSNGMLCSLVHLNIDTELPRQQDHKTCKIWTGSYTNWNSVTIHWLSYCFQWTQLKIFSKMSFCVIKVTFWTPYNESYNAIYYIVPNSWNILQNIFFWVPKNKIRYNEVLHYYGICHDSMFGVDILTHSEDHHKQLKNQHLTPFSNLITT